MCAVSLTHSLRLFKPHLAWHKCIISRRLHWMSLKLELFSHETTCLHATVISTVSVRVGVTSLPAPLAIKGSARNRQTWDWPAGHRSGPVMQEIVRFRSLAGQSVHLYFLISLKTAYIEANLPIWQLVECATLWCNSVTKHRHRRRRSTPASTSLPAGNPAHRFIHIVGKWQGHQTQVYAETNDKLYLINFYF